MRERSFSSLERSHPGRPPRERILLLADAPALGYFQDFAASLDLQNQMVFALATPEKALATLQEKIQKAGPFRRIYLLLDWAGEPDSPAHHAREAIQVFPPPETGFVRFLCCRPSFLLWILLHFEEPGAESDNVPWLEKRVAQLLADPPPQASSLFARCGPLLETAMQRSMKITRERLQAQSGDDAFPGKPGVHIHEIIPFLRKFARRHAPT
ncbi:MAG: hypothetical protein HQM02_05060 [Magnetococcales bacterium]|nr:hypothetical protein [Magnetococcales bacterium]